MRRVGRWPARTATASWRRRASSRDTPAELPDIHAEDVVADVFLVAWRRLDDVPPAADEARAWLFGVAHRTLRNGLRADQRRQALTVRIADGRLTGAAAAGLDPELVARRLDLVQA
ncbi:sigma factor [Nonomuraea jabiensis]|uniref:RNA polymerase sigma factor n=1 Tax=Nonomuraea jabiensis TaxID=882448 RepID=UPI003422DAE8